MFDKSLKVKFYSFRNTTQKWKLSEMKTLRNGNSQKWKLSEKTYLRNVCIRRNVTACGKNEYHKIPPRHAKSIASIFHWHKREIKNTFACGCFVWTSAFLTSFFSCVFFLFWCFLRGVRLEQNIIVFILRIYILSLDSIAFSASSSAKMPLHFQHQP